MGGGEAQRCCQPVLKPGGLIRLGALRMLEAQDGGPAPRNESVEFTPVHTSHLRTHCGHVCLSRSTVDLSTVSSSYFFHWHLV